MVTALTGDFFGTKAGALVNPVNCIGVMGKGLALEFKTRYPAMFLDYAARCARKELRLGEPYPYRDASGILIVNFPTKDHWRSPSRL
jgi:O-acetyl-ADP-ribose deacetylase (regulator of RNase III)